MSGKTKIQLYLVLLYNVHQPCLSFFISFPSLLCLSRSLLLISLSCLLSSSWTLLAMIPSWHSEYSPLSFTCSTHFIVHHPYARHSNDVPLTVHRILSFTICTRDVPLSIVLYRLPPVDYMRRSNNVPLSIVFYRSPPRHATFQRRTIDY